MGGSREIWFSIIVSISLHTVFVNYIFSAPTIKQVVHQSLKFNLQRKRPPATTSHIDDSKKLAILPDGMESEITSTKSTPTSDIPNITHDSKSTDILNRNSIYYSSEDVDQRATPSSDWALNTDNLESNVTITLQLKVYISAQGHMVQYELIASTVNDVQTQKLLSRFLETRFTPAFINIYPVASVREIEITIDTTAPTLQKSIP